MVTSTFKSIFHLLFLPIGYPDSVSIDYFEYQLWDTLSGFSGYLKNIILTLNFLEGLGIGQDSNVMSAMCIWIMRDTTSVLSGLFMGMPIFTKQFCDPKQMPKWRLLGDGIRIIAGFIQLYSRMCSTNIFLILTCIVVAMESCSGVMQSVSRANLINHFAIANNVSDCNAKEGNQDRGVKIFGIPAAFYLIYRLQDFPNFGLYSYIMLSVSLFFCTYKAVQSLKISEKVKDT